MGTSRGRVAAWIGGLLALSFAAALLVITGCNNEEANIAQQISSKSGGGKTAAGTAGKTAGAGQASTAKPGADATGGEATGLKTAGGGKDGIAAAEAPKLVAPKIKIESTTIKAPYPEFVGQGRYDITVSVLAEENSEPAVWRIVALDGDGKEVGHIEKYLKIPQKYARSFKLNDFFCTKAPVKVEFQLTDKQAVKPEADEKGGKAGGGAASGGGAAAGGAAGAGRGAAGAGGGGDKSGGGSSGGGSGGGDKGGGDKGGSDDTGGGDSGE